MGLFSCTTYAAGFCLVELSVTRLPPRNGNGFAACCGGAATIRPVFAFSSRSAALVTYRTWHDPPSPGWRGASSSARVGAARQCNRYLGRHATIDRYRVVPARDRRVTGEKTAAATPQPRLEGGRWALPPRQAQHQHQAEAMPGHADPKAVLVICRLTTASPSTEMSRVGARSTGAWSKCSGMAGSAARGGGKAPDLAFRHHGEFRPRSASHRQQPLVDLLIRQTTDADLFIFQYLPRARAGQLRPST